MTGLLRLAAWSWLLSVIYFLVLEGCWGASSGKRLMGLRVTSRASTGWWLRIALRTAVFHLPKAVPGFLFAAGVIGSVALGDAGRVAHHQRGVERVVRATRGVDHAAVDRTAVLDRPPWQPLDGSP